MVWGVHATFPKILLKVESVCVPIYYNQKDGGGGGVNEKKRKPEFDIFEIFSDHGPMAV